MPKFTLDFDENANEDVKLQMEYDPPRSFTSVDDAVDWALGNLPWGLAIAVKDGRGKLRASGLNGTKLNYYK